MNLTKAIYVTIHVLATGLNIDRLRIEHGYTIEEFAEMLGLASPRVYYKWKQGICLPSLEKFVVMSYIFETPVDEIIIDTEEAKRMGYK